MSKKCNHNRCRNEEECQYDHRYGIRWYLYKDGRPPLNDDNDYVWTAFQWVVEEESKS